MIEVAAMLSAVIDHGADLIIIVVLLVFNAAVGLWQEYQAGKAMHRVGVHRGLGEADGDRHMGPELPRHQQFLGAARRGLLSHAR